MSEYKIRITRQAREHLRYIRNYIQYELFAPLAAKHTITAKNAIFEEYAGKNALNT